MKKSFRTILAICSCVALCFSLSSMAFAIEPEQEDSYTYTFIVNDGEIQPIASYLGGVVIYAPKTSGTMEVSGKATVLGISFTAADYEAPGIQGYATVKFHPVSNQNVTIYGLVNKNQQIPVDGKYHEGTFGVSASYLTKGSWIVEVSSTIALHDANVAVGA